MDGCLVGACRFTYSCLCSEGGGGGGVGVVARGVLADLRGSSW